MFHAGDQIENPVTGERIVFHETSAENDGKRVVFETIVRPDGFVAAAHLHPYRLGLVMGAPVGRVLGFGPTYDSVPGELSPAI